MTRPRLLSLPNRRTLVGERHIAALSTFARHTVRTLSFQPDSTRYERIYAACVQGKAPGNRQSQKTLGDIVTKLERIGQKKPTVDGMGNPREAIADELRFYATVLGGKVILEEAEHALAVQRCADATEWIHPSVARANEDATAWLEGLEKQEAAVKPAKEVKEVKKPVDGAESTMAGH